MKRLLPVLAVLSLAATGVRADSVDEYVNAEIKRQHIPAASIAVVRNGKVVKAGGYGVANLELKVPASEDTVYEIGSLTKQFTATAVMLLADEGRLSLDAPVSRYRKDLPEAWQDVTIRQLLSHTGGIPNYTASPRFSWRKSYTWEELVDLVRDKPLDFAPGEQWSYSNTGYYLLGMVIEDVTAQSWANFLRDRLFKPLGMDRTRPNDIVRLIPRRAAGYIYATNAHINADPVLEAGAGAAGALVSTVLDLARWDAALTTRRLPLKPESYRLLWTPVRLNNGKTYPYGFGFATETRNDLRVIEHGGGTAGFSSHIARFPDRNLTVIVLTNRSGVNTGALARGIAGRIVPALSLKPAGAVKDPDSEKTAWAKGVLLSLLDDKADKSLFTREMWGVLAGPQGRSAVESLKALGPLKSFRYASQQTSGENTVFRYHVTFGETPLLLVMTRDPQGIIAGLLAGPE